MLGFTTKELEEAGTWKRKVCRAPSSPSDISLVGFLGLLWSEMRLRNLGLGVVQAAIGFHVNEHGVPVAHSNLCMSILTDRHLLLERQEGHQPIPSIPQPCISILS